MASYFVDFLYSFTNCVFCFPGSPQLKINNRSFKLLRLLGEGGFSYVYLVQENSTAALYALKKIRCPFGQESVSQAMKEVEAYSLFAPNPNIIYSVDHSIASDKSDPGAKTVYILLPYYRRGNLQDVINANLVNHSRFPERRLMILFLGVCKALKAMHQFKVPPSGPDSAVSNSKSIREEAGAADEGAKQEVEIAANSSRRRRDKMEMVPGSSYDTENEPLMIDEITKSQEGVAPGQTRAYAHRDIKPGNIMIDDDGVTPILMDLGSLAPSPTAITSRSLALAVQDTAAEHSTMPYRAPELFDVKTGSVVDSKVDIWSLGCTLYACLIGKSPFEARSEETGGSLSMCVLGGDWRFPDENPADRERGKAKIKQTPVPVDSWTVSDNVKDVVRKCLQVEPSERPDVDELMSLVQKVIDELPQEDLEE